MKTVTLVLVSFLLMACVASSNDTQNLSSKEYFSEVKGCFLLFNVKTKTFDKIINDQVCRERFPACSTFKVPLAVMAFDSHVLKDENQILKWDGVKGSREEVNRDHNAKTWIRDSVVWFSQRITPKLGKTKFQKYLNEFNYGNKDISAGITTACIKSPSEPNALSLSAYEQVDFMNKLWTDALPVSSRSMSLTRDITYLETSPKGFEMSGKTGSGVYDKESRIKLGWFISHLKKGDQEFIAVTTLSDLKPADFKGYGGQRAKDLTKKILADQNLW